MSNPLVEMLKRKNVASATPATTPAPAVPDEATQHAQVVEEIKNTEAFREAIKVFRGNDQVQRANWTPYPAMVAHGMVRLEGDAVLLTSFGRKVIDAIPLPEASPPVTGKPLLDVLRTQREGSTAGATTATPTPTQKDRLRTLSPMFTRAQGGTLDDVKAAADQIRTVLGEPTDGTVDALMRNVFQGMVNEADARIAREQRVSVVGPIDIVDMQPFVVDDPSQPENVSIEQWWRQYVGEEWGDRRSHTHNVAIDENGNDVLYEAYDNGLVTVSQGTMHIVLATPTVTTRFLRPIKVRASIANGVGSTINPPDGPGPNAPDVDDTTAKPATAVPILQLPDGRDALKLGKKDLTDAHAKVFSDVLEGSQAVKIYREFSVLPAKGRTIETLLVDLRLMLALTYSTEWRAAAEAWRNTYVSPTTSPAEAAPPTPAAEAAPPMPSVSDVNVAVSPEAVDDVLAEAKAAASTTSETTVPVETPRDVATRVFNELCDRTASFRGPITAGPSDDPAEFVLYLNCRPMRGPVTDLADFLRLFEAKVAEQNELVDYQQLPWRDGPKSVVTAIAMAANRGELRLPAALYCDKHHPCYNEVVAYLTRFATEVIRTCY